MKEGRKEEGKSVGKGAAAFGGGTKGGFSTIDTSFCLTKSQLENPSETDATQVCVWLVPPSLLSPSQAFDALEAVCKMKGIMPRSI
jgi:hypothetical protein